MNNTIFITFILILISSTVVMASTTLVDTGELDYRTNVFSNDATSSTVALIPFILLLVTVVTLMIDFGTVGVCIGSIIALIMGFSLGILQVDYTSLISLIAIIVIVIFKLRS